MKQLSPTTIESLRRLRSAAVSIAKRNMREALSHEAKVVDALAKATASINSEVLYTTTLSCADDRIGSLSKWIQINEPILVEASRAVDLAFARTSKARLALALAQAAFQSLQNYSVGAEKIDCASQHFS